LQMSAIVTVLPLNFFMVYTGTPLPFTIVVEEWLQYLRGHNFVPHKMRAVCSHGRVCHSTLLCCVKTQNVVMCWSVSNMEAWKLLFMWLFLHCNAHLTVFVSGLFICSSALTTGVWIHVMETSSLCFLKFWGCDMFWPLLAMTSGKGKVHSRTGHR
jgi:hypothetical protein